MWIGVGIGAHHFAGPAGSVTLGVAKNRNDMKKGGRKLLQAVARVGVPIAVDIFAGPAVGLGYAAVERRCWIKDYIFRGNQFVQPEPAGRTLW
jgi:hypothetical protein